MDSLLSKKELRIYLDNSDKMILAFLQVVLLNNIPMLELLLKHEVDVTTCDCMFYENGLMHAARYGHKEVLERLIECGVEVNHQCMNGSTALHIAVENIKRDCLEILTKQKGIDLNIHDNSGFSPLLWTARLRDWRAMQILLDAGCNIESKNFRRGCNALHTVVDLSQAFWKGEKASPADMEKCIDLLLNKGLDINSIDPDGNSALIYALRSNNVSGVTHLLKRNCAFLTEQQRVSLVMPFYFHKYLKGSDPELMPLYVAISKLQVLCVKMLCIAGVPYHRLAQEREIIEYMDECYPPMGDLLNEMVYKPLTLKQACRITVRKCVLKNVRFIATAPLRLPPLIFRYLSLSDLDTCML